MSAYRWMTAQALCLVIGSAVASESPDTEALQQQVEATERAFAQTMADRNFDAFVSFLADEAVFFDGDRALRGKAAVAEDWKAYFESPQAPFSWAPETVSVLDSGTLAHSSGPVLGANGVRVAVFNSVWRLEPSGEWKIVFDKGSPVCPPPTAAAD